MTKTLLCIMAIGMALLRVSPVSAQLSPGELHQSHAFLEGVENCTKCHGSGRQLVPEKCLACHTMIKERLDTHHGLHGAQAYTACQTCHVEHQGRTYDLIYWKDGQSKFDHILTGYTLEGKHKSLDCRSCHIETFIKDRARLQADKTTLSKTFLGLSPACVNCHFDEHRGQVSLTCSDCHNSTVWKPAAGFEHNKTKYALIGKHIDVLCAKCHPTLSDNRPDSTKTYLKLVSINHDACTDCHSDVHKGKLGANCQNCHSTAGWHVTNTAQFDHSKTRYPLEGKHITVACDKCHSPGNVKMQLKFAACRDCHSDFHKGAFAQRPQQGACEECHTVAGYTPSRFLMSRHDQTRYPLKGAHRAIPCVACHSRTVGTHPAVISYQFKFTTVACLECHKDPHRGEVNKFVSQKGCEFCHVESSWKQVNFDHNLSDFHLEGKHAAVACDKCHSGQIAGQSTLVLTFVGASKLCQDCHKDIHRGQFANADSSSTDCSRCHTSQNWKAEKFNHNVLSGFKLDGAHINVPCEKCHRPTMVDNAPFVAYKPLDTSCAACHGASKVLEKEKKS